MYATRYFQASFNLTNRQDIDFVFDDKHLDSVVEILLQ